MPSAYVPLLSAYNFLVQQNKKCSLCTSVTPNERPDDANTGTIPNNFGARGARAYLNLTYATTKCKKKPLGPLVKRSFGHANLWTLRSDGKDEV